MNARLEMTGILVALVAVAPACLWDSDTLAQEAKGHLDFIRIVTGRFERNPPLYYEMRLARVKQELQRDPTTLLNYDDAGVACDRVGLDEEAIQWMARKKRFLKPLPADKDAWYRYYANLGTFHAHRWFRGGAKPESLAEMRMARILIAKAIEINPDAHFGREAAQLGVIDWAIEVTEGQHDMTLGRYLHHIGDGTQAGDDRRIIGLLGLIALGNAWESVDTFAAIAELTFGWKSQLIHFAEQRTSELIDQGKTSIDASLGRGETLKSNLWIGSLSHLVSPLDKANEEAYKFLRNEAENYRNYRTSYMMERLKAGRHPDTDPNFWKDYHEKPPPAMPEPTFLVRVTAWAQGPGMPIVFGFICCGLPVIGGGTLWIVLRRRARAKLPPPARSA